MCQGMQRGTAAVFCGPPVLMTLSGLQLESGTPRFPFPRRELARVSDEVAGVSGQGSGLSLPASSPTWSRPQGWWEAPVRGVRAAAHAGASVQASPVPGPARLIF